MFNLVEAMADEDEQAETPCIYGNLVVGHSVYCHNDEWSKADGK